MDHHRHGEDHIEALLASQRRQILTHHHPSGDIARIAGRRRTEQWLDHRVGNIVSVVVDEFVLGQYPRHSTEANTIVQDPQRSAALGRKAAQHIHQPLLLLGVVVVACLAPDLLLVGVKVSVP
ncbi:hypothetical protein D3C81_1414090 [compost metagenome]